MNQMNKLNILPAFLRSKVFLMHFLSHSPVLVETSHLYFPSNNYQILDKRKSVSGPSTAHILCANAGGKTGEYSNDCFITEQGSLFNLSATWLGISHFDTKTREPVLQMNVQMLKRASPNSYAPNVTLFV